MFKTKICVEATTLISVTCSLYYYIRYQQNCAISVLLTGLDKFIYTLLLLQLQLVAFGPWGQLRMQSREETTICTEIGPPLASLLYVLCEVGTP
jgi:hypothetical protein